MKYMQFKGLWWQDCWLEPAWVGVDADGLLQSVAAQPPADAAAKVEHVPGYALPGFVNAHSHAFQYAMAGRAEHLPPAARSDDFWSWRQAMYALALQIDPDTMEAVATMLYAEMLRHGFTSVVEFHYLHNNPAGKAYRNPAEMSARLLAAAETAGIAICLVPIYYNTGDFGTPAGEGQRRFLCRDAAEYFRLLERCNATVHNKADMRVGVGVHSLRAAGADDIRTVFDAAPAENAAARHIHIAEQVREVESCLAFYKARPVEWLLDNVAVDSTYHLVHATHMNAAETEKLARSGATAVLCPGTEGNLGDGFFPLETYRAAGGSWTIGTDSHIGLSPLEELRLLDYGARLRLQRRNILCRTGGDDSGECAVRESIAGGLRSMGLSQQAPLAIGLPFDALVLDDAFPPLAALPARYRLSALVYAGDPAALLGTIRRGKWLVREGAHRFRDNIRERYRKALHRLYAA